VYFDGHFVTDIVARELAVRIAPAHDDVPPDPEERRRIVAAIDDRHDTTLAVDVLQPEA